MKMGKVLLRLLIAAVLVCIWTATASFIEVPEETPAPTPSPEEISVPGPPSAAPTPTPIPTPEPTPIVYTITMVGDCTLSSSQYYKNTSYGFETVVGDDYAYPFAKTLDYFIDDDFTFANLESPLTESSSVDRSKAFYFKADPAYVDVLTEGSVEFVTIGNNHALDFGEQGYEDTKATLERAGIGCVGRDEWSLHTTDSGLTIGVYALSFGTADQIKAGIRAVREAGAEFVIAALHWGTEGFYDVNATQRAQGHAAIDAGADFVYGSHPHTLQPVEEYKGRYIYYSMGNWTFGGNTNPRDKDTVIVRPTLVRSVDGELSIAGIENIPCASSGEENRNNYQPVPYEPGSEGYARTISKLDGSFDGANLTVGYAYGNE
jgi:poly-gamma-glutamate synthesis protein (capsule biosynthesis protein)